jgi:uncharacterized membrane-anchored protein YhcB (DUF1043 family)
VVFVLFVLSNVVEILVYILLSFIFTVFFFFVKVRLYSGNIRQSYKTEDEEPASKRFILLIILVLIFGISLPFLLLFLVDPLIWFLIITSFIAGINIPEIILYINSTRSYRNKKEEKAFGEEKA